MLKVPTRTESVTDPAAGAWLIDDVITSLREWGATLDRAFLLPLGAGVEVAIGRSPPAAKPPGRVALRLGGRGVSAFHALLRRVGPAWVLYDHKSRNGVYVNGAPTTTTRLLPGAIVGLGKVRLVVHSSRIDALYALWQRHLGWATDAATLEAIDAALWATHELATMRGHVLIRGHAGRALALRLHELARGDAWPFVAPTEDIATAADVRALCERAAHGTLYLRDRQYPRHVQRMIFDAVAAGDHAIRLILTMDARPDPTAVRGLLGAAPLIEVPAITRRGPEVEQLVAATVSDWSARLGATGAVLLDANRALLGAWRFTEHDDLDDTVHRLVALRRFDGPAAAAREVGVTTSAMSQWIRAAQGDRILAGARVGPSSWRAAMRPPPAPRPSRRARDARPSRAGSWRSRRRCVRRGARAIGCGPRSRRPRCRRRGTRTLRATGTRARGRYRGRW